MTHQEVNTAFNFWLGHGLFSRTISVYYENFSFFKKGPSLIFSSVINIHDPKFNQIGLIGTNLVLTISNVKDVETIEVYKYGINIRFRKNGFLNKKADLIEKAITSKLQIII